MLQRPTLTRQPNVLITLIILFRQLNIPTYSKILCCVEAETGSSLERLVQVICIHIQRSVDISP